MKKYLLTLLALISCHVAYGDFLDDVKRFFTGEPKINRKVVATQKWRAPSGNRLYNRTTFMTYHNAFASTGEGFKGSKANQTRTLKDQLHKFGVRGFMLDTWDHGGKILLCHGGCTPNKANDNLGSKSKKFQTFSSFIKTTKDFLKNHQNEVVTYFLENRVNNDKLKREILKDKEFASMILTPRDWNPDEHLDHWPTLSWMRKNNKRVVIFNEDKSKSRKSNINDPFYFIYDYVIETQWGTVDRNKASNQRKESKAKDTERPRRQIVLLNFFQKRKVEPVKVNTKESLTKLIEACKLKGVGGHLGDWQPTFIALDFGDEGTAMDLVNKLNGTG